MNRLIAAVGCFALLAACSGEPAENAAGNNGEEAPLVSFFSGARVIPGDGSAPIENAIFVINAGKITQMGKQGDFQPPGGSARVPLNELTGTPMATVIPALVNIEALPGVSNGPSFSMDNYKAESVTNDLKRYEYYGVFNVAGSGHDTGDVAYQIRDNATAMGAKYFTAGQGITARGGYPSAVLEGSVIEVGSEEEARKAVTDLAAKKVNFIKIFVNGTPKLTPAQFTAIIDEASKSNLKVIADAPALADAKALVNAGVAGLANSITDANVDGELIAAMKQRNVFIAPALVTIESKFIFADQPDWLGEQFMREAYPPQLSAYLANNVTVNSFRRNRELPALRQQFATAQRNLKALSDAGVKIALGTGSGSKGTFPGYSEHRELELMVAAGLTPVDALKTSAVSAEFLGIPESGVLGVDKVGDFIVLASNPADDIAALKTAQQVYRAGSQVNQGALIEGIPIDVPKITEEDRRIDTQLNRQRQEEDRIAALPKFGKYPNGTAAQVRGLAIPTPLGARSSVQAGPPDRVTVTLAGASPADLRGFYAQILPRYSWQAAGECWQRQHPISSKPARLCLEGNVVQITEQ